ALARVGEARFQPYVVLPRAVRPRLYELSPAFRELEPYLEARTIWETRGPRVLSTPGEVFGGWFLWALRDAVQRAGDGDSAPEALAFYRRLAQEVNAACDSGLIPCGPPRDSLVPRWNPAYRDALWRSTWDALVALVTWRECRGNVPLSGGMQAQLDLFAE